MADPTPAQLQAEIDAANARLDKLEKSTSIVGAITGWISANPAIAHTLNAVISAALGALLAWLSGLGGSVVTKEVPGPEKTIIREVPGYAYLVPEARSDA